MPPHYHLGLLLIYFINPDSDTRLSNRRGQGSAELCVMSRHEQMGAVAPTENDDVDDDGDAVVPPAEDNNGDHNDGCCSCWG